MENQNCCIENTALSGVAKKKQSDKRTISQTISDSREIFKTRFVREKYRFDVGMAFLSFINFALLVITASGKLSTLIPLSTTQWLLLMLPTGFAGVWLFGYVIDKSKMLAYYNRELNERNEMMNEILNELKKLNEKPKTNINYPAELDFPVLD